VALVLAAESSATDAGLSELPIFAAEEEMLQERSTVWLNCPVALTVSEVPRCPEAGRDCRLSILKAYVQLTCCSLNRKKLDENHAQ
jgi:hypothetical protein